MKKQIIAIVLPILLLTLTAATVHKFHMALYQINYASEKKMLQITSRIHIEDLNKALEKKYQKKITIESENSSAEELLLKEYLSNRFSIKVNGQVKPLNFLSKEIDGDELVCYWNIKNISKISHLEVNNSILIECFSDQQNMINVTVLGAKKSFLLTNSTTSKTLKY
ncbi:MAG TPA: hypothetical protein DCM02_07520 [Flavobacterium sp.]|nr:hypothetical protein [Flavobacterium sp.]HAT75514.1 hypothetical protein [Flavobacterium sp.]HAT80667.1 hypothetical protein [Flavobacterium sp.]